MKTIAKRIVIGVMLFAATTACKKDKEEVGYGAMKVRMTDAPAAYAEVNVEIREVQIAFEDTEADSNSNSGWTILETEAGVYNLLELQNGVSTALAEDLELRTGRVNQMRLILGQNNHVVLADSSTVNLEMSSQTQTGIKLNLNTEVQADQTLEVLIDFDADKSIVVEGSGSLKLKPVIAVASVETL